MNPAYRSNMGRLSGAPATEADAVAQGILVPGQPIPAGLPSTWFVMGVNMGIGANGLVYTGASAPAPAVNPAAASIAAQYGISVGDAQRGIDLFGVDKAVQGLINLGVIHPAATTSPVSPSGGVDGPAATPLDHRQVATVPDSLQPISTTTVQPTSGVVTAATVGPLGLPVSTTTVAVPGGYSGGGGVPGSDFYAAASPTSGPVGASSQPVDSTSTDFMSSLFGDDDTSSKWPLYLGVGALALVLLTRHSR